jgi:XTP/dITP diphosphohydrolase
MFLFATNNSHKLEEARQILLQPIISLSDLSLTGDIPETAETLEGNALQKAQFVWDRLRTSTLDAGNIHVFADDTGLEVEALQNEPGVYSARYANFPLSKFPQDKKAYYASLPDPPFNLNIEKLLKALHPQQNRKACFRTVICLLHNGDIHYFEGRIDGYILREPQGEMGFGYDSVFCPVGYQTAGANNTPKSFASLSAEEKNAISHRGNALRAMNLYIKKHTGL